MIVVNKNLEISLTIDEVIVEVKQSNDIIELFALAISAIRRINTLDPATVELLVETYPKSTEDWQKDMANLTDLLTSKIEKLKSHNPTCDSDKDGNKVWKLNGKRHRVDGPAVEYADGYKSWWVNGKLHREDGPAIEYANGDKAWYVNGKRHRIDGPAVERVDGHKEWWVSNEQITEQQFIEWKESTNVK